MSTATHSAPVLTATPRRRRPRRSWIHTVIGIVLVAIMLFPVYWMLNASLAPAGNSLNTQWLPLDPDFSGYSRAIADQGQNLVTLGDRRRRRLPAVDRDRGTLRLRARPGSGSRGPPRSSSWS